MKLMDQGPFEITKVTEDTSRIVIKFVVPGETQQRTIDFTYLLGVLSDP